jgi:hypothetical protein
MLLEASDIVPQGTFPQNWDIALKAVLQEKIARVIRKKIPETRIRKEDILLVAARFLKLYRENLRASDTIQNLSVPSSYYPGPLEGYNVVEARMKPLWGMIGIPAANVGMQFRLIEKIKLGKYARLTAIRTGGGAKQGGGILEFDFSAFRQDDDATYHDGTTTISWVELVEYGFNVPGYLYLPNRGIPQSRSGHGIMRASQKYNFAFGATHIFEGVFNATKRLLTPRERLILAINFRE